MTLLLTDPVDTLCPPSFRLDGPFTLAPSGHSDLWISPDGNYCFGLNYMHEDGRMAFTILAYRTIEVFP